MKTVLVTYMILICQSPQQSFFILEIFVVAIHSLLRQRDWHILGHSSNSGSLKCVSIPNFWISFMFSFCVGLHVVCAM